MTGSPPNASLFAIPACTACPVRHRRTASEPWRRVSGSVMVPRCHISPPARCRGSMASGLLECDGFEARADYLRWKRDRRRIAAIEAEGYHFMHVTWDDVTKRGDEVVRRCRAALGRARTIRTAR